MRRKITLQIMFLSAFALGLGGCDDLVFDGTRGDLTVAAIGSTSEGGPVGTIEFDVRVDLVADMGPELTVLGQAAAVTIEPGPRTIIATRRLDEQRITRVRMTFTRVDATVDGGLLIGGSPFLGRARVQMPPEGVIVVERTVELDLRPQGRATVTVDLNAPEWLRRVDTVRREITAEDFAAAVRIRVES